MAGFREWHDCEMTPVGSALGWNAGRGTWEFSLVLNAWAGGGAVPGVRKVAATVIEPVAFCPYCGEALPLPGREVAGDGE